MRIDLTTNPMYKFLGFTLVEMAVVLVILGLVIGGLFVPISAQVDQRNYSETRQRMIEIKEALIGFAILNGRFPCPSTVTNPADAGFGVEAASCSSTAEAEGYLPWKTLGVYDVDAWGEVQKTSDDGMLGYWRYRVDRNFSVTFNMTTAFSADDVLKVQDHAGNTLATDAGRPVVIFYSTGKNRFADRGNRYYETTNGVYESDIQSTDFDDHLVWISRPLLMNRMVTAGKLP